MDSSQGFGSAYRIQINSKVIGIQNPVLGESTSSYQQPSRESLERRQKLGRIKRCQFFAIFAVSFGVLAWQTVQCVLKYLARDTATGDKYLHVSAAPFPELTICPTYPYDVARLAAHGLTRSDLQWNARWVSDRPDVSPLEVYDDVVLPLDKVVRHVEIRTIAQVDGETNFTITNNNTFCDEHLYTKKPYYYNGECFAFVLPSCLNEAGTTELVFNFYNKTDIFIHHSGNFLNPNSRSRVDVGLGFEVMIALTHEVVHLLSEGGDCVDDFPLSYGDNSFDGCMYYQLYQMGLNTVGCTVPWLQNKSSICTEEADRQQAFDQYQKNRRNQNNICPSSCLFTNMYFGPSLIEAGAADSAVAHFHFRRDIKTTEEYFLYSPLSLFSEIGGLVGLLMGVSFFKLADVNNYFLDVYAAKKDVDLYGNKKY